MTSPRQRGCIDVPTARPARTAAGVVGRAGRARAAARRVGAVAALLVATTAAAADDAIDAPAGVQPGDPARGRAIVASRPTGLCLLCHAAPIPEERFQGDLAPDLAGVGTRRSAGQLRLRLVDPRRLNPASIMPSYRRTDGLTRVAPAFVGRPLLSEQQVEDVVAYLQTLK